MHRGLCVLLGVLLVPTVGFVGDIVTDGRFKSSMSTGAPLEVASDDMVLNLNADMVDGVEGTDLYTKAEVDALFAAATANSLNAANVVMVAKSGGAYTSIQAAIDSISDAGADNPYLVWVAPGVYDETVAMKPHVHLQGACQEVTVMTSTVSTGSPPTEATIVLDHHVSLRDVTVTNTGSGTRQVAVLATAGTSDAVVESVRAESRGGSSQNFAVHLSGAGTDVTLSRVTVLAEDTDGFGLYNGNGSTVTVEGGTFTGSVYGIHNTGADSTVTAIGVSAVGEGGTNTYGLYNSGGGAVAILWGGSFVGRDSLNNACGIYNTDSAEIHARDVYALGENADTSTGFYNSPSGTVAEVHGGSTIGSGGMDARGMDNGGTLRAQGVVARGEGGTTDNYGLTNSGGAADVVLSTLEGASNSVYRTSGTVTVSLSRLTGTVSGAATCVAVTQGITFYASSCP